MKPCAGKSVTLETIAGFYRESAGRIAIRGRDVTGLPPEQRNVGLLFQNFGLLPHLSVAENVASGLRARRARVRAEGIGRTADLLARFAIAHVAVRRPAALSPRREAARRPGTRSRQPSGHLPSRRALLRPRCPHAR